MNPNVNEALLTEKQAATFIAMSVSFLRQSRMDGQRRNRCSGPPWVQAGRSVRYDPVDLEKWKADHRRFPTEA